MKMAYKHPVRAIRHILDGRKKSHDCGKKFLKEKAQICRNV